MKNALIVLGSVTTIMKYYGYMIHARMLLTGLCKDTRKLWHSNETLFINYEEHWYPGRRNLLKLLHELDKNKYLRFLYLSELVFHMFWMDRSSIEDHSVYEIKILEKLIVKQIYPSDALLKLSRFLTQLNWSFLQDLSIIWYKTTEFVEISPSLPQLIKSAHNSIVFENVNFDSKDTQNLFDNAINTKSLKLNSWVMEFGDFFELSNLIVYKLEDLSISINAKFSFKVGNLESKTSKFIQILGNSSLPKSLKRIWISISKLKPASMDKILSISEFKHLE